MKALSFLCFCQVCLISLAATSMAKVTQASARAVSESRVSGASKAALWNELINRIGTEGHRVEIGDGTVFKYIQNGAPETGAVEYLSVFGVEDQQGLFFPTHLMEQREIITFDDKQWRHSRQRTSWVNLEGALYDLRLTTVVFDERDHVVDVIHHRPEGPLSEAEKSQWESDKSFWLQQSDLFK